MLRRALAGSRYLVIIVVIGTFLASIAVLVYGAFTVVSIIIDVFTHGFTITGAKYFAVDASELIDLFLLGIVLYIVALGLYNLFIDDTLPMPHWLEIVNLEDLKGRLLGIVVVLLAVTFLGYVVDWNGTSNILALGIAVGVVLFALGFLLNGGLNVRHHQASDKDEAKKEM